MKGGKARVVGEDERNRRGRGDRKAGERKKGYVHRESAEWKGG